jgi:Ca-activated chloride channel family protein
VKVRVLKFWILLIGGTLSLAGGLFDFYTYGEINQAYKEGRYKDALTGLKSVEDSPIRNYDLGVVYYKLKDYSQALDSFKRAYGEGVNEYYRVHNIGNCYFMLEEYADAITAYKEAIKLGSDDGSSRRNLLVAEMKLKEESKKKKKKKKRKKHSKKRDPNSDADNNKSGKKNLTKEELKKLQEMLKRKEFSRELKSMLKRSLENDSMPVLMYKVKDGNTETLKPW